MIFNFGQKRIAAVAFVVIAFWLVPFELAIGQDSAANSTAAPDSRA